MKYKYLFFDIDDTLIDFRKTFRAAARRVIEHAGGEINDETANVFYTANKEVWKSLNLHRLDNMHIRTDYHALYGKYLWETVDTAAKTLGLLEDSDSLLIYFLKMLGECAVLSPNVIPVCGQLRRECKLYVATNGLMCSQPQKIARIEYLFDKVYISHEVGKIKPEKEYFEYILNDIGCKATECLMIGDSLPNDIKGAAGAGIATCFYNPILRDPGDAAPTYMIKDFTELIDILR